MEPVLNLYKESGETPLQRIKRLREVYPEYSDKKMTYAGRLDPMAEGVLLVLTGEECKSKESYLKLPKIYTFEVLFGIETDTYDILGKVLDISPPPVGIFEKVGEYVKEFEGEIEQKYPPFSSKPVAGKPLFEWAKEGKLSGIELPSKMNTVYKIEVEGSREVNVSEIYSKVYDIVSNLEGEFRQKEILKNWEEVYSRCEIGFPAVSIKVECSSGTYVRDIAHRLGIKLGGCATAMRIVREGVGLYSIADSIH